MPFSESSIRPREAAEQRRKRLAAERKARLERAKTIEVARRKRINETIALGEQVRSVTPYRGKSRTTARPLSDKDFLELISSDQPTGLSPKGILKGLRQDVEAHTGLLSLAGLAKPVEDNPFAGMTLSTLNPVAATGALVPKTVKESRALGFIPRGRDYYGKRYQKYGDASAQLPASPSLATALLQIHVFDPLSEGLATKVVDPLRASKNVVAQTAGKVLTPLSARARVPKNLGKLQGIRESRIRARHAVETQLLGSHGKDSGPFQVAQHWYGQLPSAARTPDGLARAREGIKSELHWYASGQAQKELGQRAAVLQASLRDPEVDYHAVLRELEKVRLHLAEIPKIMESQSHAIRKLDLAIKKNVPFDEETHAAKESLAGAREEELRRAGLPEEKIQGRKGIVAEWAGFEKDGTEVFTGHRAKKVRGGKTIVPGAASSGKTKAPEGFFTKNETVLIRRGQQRTDMEVHIEDFNAAMRYGLVNNAKDEIAEMGSKYTGSINPDTQVLVNRSGQKVNRTWDEDLEERFAREGFDAKDIKLDETDLGQYVSNTVGIDLATIKEVEKKAVESGTWDDLVVVPRDVFDRYWNQFVDFRPANLGGTTARGINAAKKGITGLNDIVAFSLIYSNPLSYIPPNLAGNMLFAGAHQGLFLPENLTRAGQVLFGPKDVRALLLREAGEMGSTALAQGAPLKRIARAEGYVTDAGPRISAVLHELAAKGVISRGKPVLTEKDYDAIRTFIKDPKNEPVMNDIFETVQRSMVDFRLGPWEKTYLRRGFLVYPWLKGATKYPYQFIKDHPVRSAILGTAAATHRDEIDERLSDAPPAFAKPALALGEVEIRGKKFPRVLPTGAFSPLQTAIGIGKSAIGDRDARLASEYIVPGPVALFESGRKRNPYGGQEDSYRDAAKAWGLRLAPSAGFAQDLISPPKSLTEADLYPGDVSRLGRIARQTRVVPFAVSEPESRRLDRTRRKKPAKTAKEEKTAELRRATRISKHYGKKVSDDYTKALDAKYTYSERREQLKDQIDVEKLSESQDVALLLSVLGQHRPDLLEEGQAKYEEIKGDEERMHKMYLRLRDILGFNYLSEANEKLNAAEKKIKAAA